MYQSLCTSDIAICNMKGKARDHQNLPSAQEQSRNEIQNWGSPAQDPELLNQDGETDGESKE